MPRPSAPSPSVPSAGPLQLRDASRYDLIGEHGRGGLGRVLRAHDKELGRDIAIKELLERTHSSEVRFFREALITARLEHPNIVPVHEAGRWADGTPFYAMKLVSGRPLKQLIDSATTLADRLALLSNVIAIVDAIAYAHDHRVLHRDLKPSNVIVGDFGETVVIDWGLAKVLDEPEPPVDTPYRTAGRDELTAAGVALGTPAYMAPEQALGKSDERSDIYALGGILHQVLTGHAPNEDRAYPAGTPRDLISIADRALAGDPARRYQRAMELGDDLRRFARRERVSARRYSLPARIALFTARHKTFAVMLVAGLVALSITLSISLAKIADQRADAFAARNEADFARKRAEDAKDALTLKHVELLMKSDPTAALAALHDYHGLDENRRRQLEAEALGRGVAREVATPHHDMIHAAIVDTEGAVISISEDRKVQRTFHGTTTTLANDASSVVCWARSAKYLAYASSPNGISLVDLDTRLTTKLTQAGAPESLAFSTDGARLAAIDHDGTLRVWQLGPSASLVRDDRVSEPIAIAFAGASRIVVWHTGGLRSLDLEDGTSRSVEIEAKPYDDAADRLRLTADEHRIVIGGQDGNLGLYSPKLEKLAGVKVCTSGIHAVQLIGDRIAYACRDGSAGIVSASLAIEHRFAFPLPISVFTIDSAGAIAAAASDATLFIHDLRTGITARRDGHASRITAISIDHDSVISADLGAIRRWDIPRQRGHVVAALPTGLRSGDVTPDGKTLTAFSVDGVIHLFDLATGSEHQLRGHTAQVWFAVFSHDGALMATPSDDGTVRVWRRSDNAMVRVFASHHSIVPDVGFLDDTHLVSAGSDGTLRMWSAIGDDDMILFRRSVPLIGAEPLAADRTVVVLDSSGDVWRVAIDGTAQALHPAGDDPVTSIKRSLDNKLLALNTLRGSVIVYRTSDWSILANVRTEGAPYFARFDPLDRDLMIASMDGRLREVPLTDHSRIAWSDFAVRPIDIRYSLDGNMLAIGMLDGGVWLYDIPTTRWAYGRDAGELWRARFTPDGESLMTIDADGTIVQRSVSAMFDAASQEPTR